MTNVVLIEKCSNLNALIGEIPSRQQRGKMGRSPSSPQVQEKISKCGTTPTEHLLKAAENLRRPKSQETPHVHG